MRSHTSKWPHEQTGSGSGSSSSSSSGGGGGGGGGQSSLGQRAHHVHLKAVFGRHSAGRHQLALAKAGLSVHVTAQRAICSPLPVLKDGRPLQGGCLRRGGVGGSSTRGRLFGRGSVHVQVPRVLGTHPHLSGIRIAAHEHAAASGRH